MKILLTGFGPFGAFSVNPSQTIVERLEAVAGQGHGVTGAQLVTAVLPTEFSAAGERVMELLHAHHPAAMLGLGLAAELPWIALERFALNVDDSEVADNAGDAPSDRVIVEGGPSAYRTTLPLPRLYGALREPGVPVRISNHAGTFVCNHVFYLARHEIERAEMQTACGFLHLPLPSPEVPTEETRGGGPPLSSQLRAIRRCLDVLAKYLGTRSADGAGGNG